MKNKFWFYVVVVLLVVSLGCNAVHLVRELIGWVTPIVQEFRDSFTEETPEIPPAISDENEGATPESAPPVLSEQLMSGIPGEDDGVSCIYKVREYPYNPLTHLRFETQSNTPQLNDLYKEGTETILVIEGELNEPGETSGYVWGWGSAWAYRPDRTGCEWLIENQEAKLNEIEGLDIESVLNPEGVDGIQWDAISHSIERIDQGHSGLVIDKRQGDMKVIANINDLSELEIQALIEMYLDTGEGQPGILGCGTAERFQDFGKGQTVGPFEGNIVVANPWWGDLSMAPDPGGQIAVVLRPGQSMSGSYNGGSLWVYPQGCSIEQVVDNVFRSPFPLYHQEDGKWVAGPPQ